jgi:GT2 family glycosyltransferase
MTDKPPLVSVIFPTLNSAKLLPKFFTSLKRQDYPARSLEVIVVDNGSSDETCKYIKAKHPNVRLLSIDHNTGSALAENFGAAVAKGEFLFITNDDALFNSSCISDLVTLITSHPNIGMVSGKLLYQQPPNTLAWPGFRLNPYLGFHPHDLSNLDKIRESDWFSGPAMLIRKSVFASIGGFDPVYFFCGEDYDLSIRIRKAGYLIMYCPTATIHHGFTRNRLNHSQKDKHLYLHYRGKIRSVLKHASLLQTISSLIFIVILTPAYKPRYLFPIIKAVVWNLYHLP